MNQSTIIFGYLAVAFLIFITQRGELPIYWGFLVKSPQSPSQGPSGSGSGSVTGSNLAQTVSTITSVAATLSGG